MNWGSHPDLHVFLFFLVVLVLYISSSTTTARVEGMIIGEVGP